MNPFANQLNPGSIGQHVQQSFMQGRQMRQSMESQNALSQYAMNPQDPKTREAMARWNPEMAIQIQQKEAEQQKALLEQNRDKLIKGAQIVRQLGVKDQATWDQARAVAQQFGIDLSDVPAEYNPQYIQGLVAVADSFAPQKQNEGPASVQEYQFAKQQGFQGSYMDFMEEKRGPIVANNGDGTFTLIPRGAMGGQGAVPPPPPGFVIDGGPTPQASGGFPDPLAPR